MRAGKRLWLAASLLLVISLITGGCASKSKAIEPLTDVEKEAMVDIALNHPEVMQWLGGSNTYVTEVGWAAIGWNDEGKYGECDCFLPSLVVFEFLDYFFGFVVGELVELFVEGLLYGFVDSFFGELFSWLSW